ncbi:MULTISPECIES: amidohydrolase [Halorubrum]|uniref:Aminobenzoyl-glutamate utilization protein A n=1 Tax=Halorubrum sodomense TaxID=35743 RepID=A0A1I6H1D3_HALSD|nr:MULTISPECIES: amidohydrolase [Halorubrum]TKX68490.1 amidohydrolase [Halorubrum sp. SP9]SFR48275.1 aminobenzoyl-glutamate utilization protein A [Halorubrum sodomense]
MSALDSGEYRSFRRDLHRHPEPAWREFYTTARIVEALRERDLTGLHVGPDALAADERLNVPDDEELAEWEQRAREAGADPEVLEQLSGGYTGCVAVVERGDGPVVGLRVDIDGLPITESESGDHVPAGEGFRSEHEGFMHACGHDAHATMGLGALDVILDSDFSGTLKVFFQPGEEQIVGGKPMAESGHLDDVDYLYAVHVGLDHPSGEVVCGIEGFLAVRHFLAEFTGEPAHAGARPEQGRNTVQAMAAAIQNLYAIPRHADGPTRVNAGLVGGGTATNIIPEESYIEGEVRGQTTDLAEYMSDHADRVLDSAAEMHDCEVDVSTLGEAPSATSDDALAGLVRESAGDVSGVTNIVDSDELGGSEDATYLMNYVQEQGGLACYLGVGTDHPGGHHTSDFDVVEDDIGIGIDVIAGAIRRVAETRP